MRCVIVADIHANWPALRAVLRDVQEREQRIGAYWCLGDIVGYGPHPVEALQFLKAKDHPRAWVPGNHDLGLAGKLPPDMFGGESDRDAWKALEAQREDLKRHHPALWAWCRRHFSDQPQHLIRSLVVDGAVYVLVHGALESPYLGYRYAWESPLLLSADFKLLGDLEMGLKPQTPRFLLYGHTHWPSLILAESAPCSTEMTRSRYSLHAWVSNPRHPKAAVGIAELGGQFPVEELPYDTPLALGEGMAMINPGSVGQPRDGNTAACYAVLDTRARTVEFRRVRYPVSDTQRDMTRLDYPYPLITRLERGQ